MSRIAKIKFKDGLWQIVEISGEGSHVESETTHKIYEEPHPDLPAALAGLVSHAREILEWPTSYADNRVRITGVSFSHSEDTGVEGAVITGFVDLDTSDSPFSFNTPHLPFEQYKEGNTAKLMPDGAIDALENLRTEAAKFLKGKRAQGNLFERAA
ncbi:hypothetical protein [Hyphomicrobium sp. DY-1]|uniref:hypothetical protein n=1 Tax=Hyphomicrobium sp. DY-1 TaxID=3075650 RepID=UPI0039C42C3D